MIQYKIENSKRNMNLQKLVIKQRGQIQAVAYESIIYIEGSNHLVKIRQIRIRKRKSEAQNTDGE